MNIDSKTKKKIITNMKENCSFRTRLPNYTPLSILTRVGVLSLYSFLLVQFMVNVYKTDTLPTINFFQYIKVFLYFLALSELQILFDLFLERILPIPEKIRFRIVAQTIIGVALFILVFQVAIHFTDYRPDIPKYTIYLGLAIGLLFVSMFSSSLLILRLTEKWIFSQKEMDRLKQAKIITDYNFLQDQVNPHFLFNNLSALKSLIMIDQKRAIDFTENFTDIYRYVLQGRDKMVITVEKELEFINAYIQLHKVRLGNGLETEITIERSYYDREIPPLSLQLLVENAIKHNITSKASPLSIKIFIENDYMVVKNNNQKKESSYSTNTGLSNLKRRYEMLTERKIIIFEDRDTFSVSIPLL